MKFIPTTLTRSFGRQILQVKGASPSILFGVGIIGSIASTVLACRATLKLEETLADIEKNVMVVKSTVAEDQDTRRDLLKVYARGTADIAKLYAPSVLIGVASLGALTASHNTLNQRNAGLTAAYAAVHSSYEAYRDRVREELGDEKELDIYHAASYKEVVVNDKKVLARVVDPNKFSPYARFFDEGSIHWVKNPEYNRLRVQATQAYLNQLLQSRGHVFLNEAYEELGIPRTQAGQVVGWVIGNGDNFIDFGIFEASNSDFVNGHERSMLLDFNVDGVILNLIEE